MKTVYTSYEEIDKELEIRKLEREISFRKLSKNADDISQFFTPANFIKGGLLTLGSNLRHSKEIKTFVLSTLMNFMINKFIKRK